MVEGVSGLLSVHHGHDRPVFESSKKQITWPNGAIAQIFSAEDPESLRGPQFSHAWCDVLTVRKARAAIAAESNMSFIQMDRKPSDDVRPVWVIVVFEVRSEKLIGITEFVFESYEECQLTSAEAKKKLGLRLKPVCYLRWMEVDRVSKGTVM